MKKRFYTGALFAITLLAITTVAEKSGTGSPLLEPRFTIDSDHFRINYTAGLHPVARRTADILENLYGIYRDSFQIVLPSKTEVLLVDNDRGEGFAAFFTNTLCISANGHDFINMRGSHDYLKDVITHEYAHLVSIIASLKGPPWLLGLQLGYFDHPNIPNRVEALHMISSEILPMWFTEGIAQYESLRHGVDTWDSHRDMILRTRVLTGTLASYDKMCVYTGEDIGDFEKNYYNQGFALVKYIAETYGHASIIAMLREAGRMTRLDFDGAARAVLGKSIRTVYAEWKKSLESRYRLQTDALGKQAFGHRVSKDGYNNYYPIFAPDGKKIYFISNGKEPYAYFDALFSYSLVDTVKKDKRIKPEMGIKDYYSIHDKSGLISFSSMKSAKSITRWNQGGGRTRDAFIDTLPREKPKFDPFKKKTERQITERQSVFQTSFSPAGNRLAFSIHRGDRYYLGIMDTNGKNMRIVYPDTSKAGFIQTIYTLDWSPDGRSIAISYIDTADRGIGIYDTATGTFRTICSTPSDERDPRFTRDGKSLLFSSDRSGIFNVYRYTFAQRTLERLTNVSGGAMSPDATPDQKRLAFTGYDKDGFHIYLMDTVTALHTDTLDSAEITRAKFTPAPPTAVVSAPREYSRMPRQFMFVPTMFSEQAVTENNNPFKGRAAFKAGGVLYASDPFSSFGGIDLGAILLLEPSKILSFIAPDEGLINPEMNYDLGVFGSTSLFPIGISADYSQRGIAGSDIIYDEATGRILDLKYSLTPHWATLVFSKKLSEIINNPLIIHGVASYSWLDETLIIKDSLSYWPAFGFIPQQGYRLGVFASLLMRENNSRMVVSPTGLYLKGAYDFHTDQLQNEDERFNSSSSVLAVNYDDYRFHQLSLSAKFGTAMPWSDKQHLYAELAGTSLILTESSKKELRENNVRDELPSYFQPVIWLPGYTYYYRDTAATRSYRTIGANGKDSVAYYRTIIDTVLLTGNHLSQLKLSYRFPLWPKTIGIKAGFLYFDWLYGIINAHAGTAWLRPSDFKKTQLSDVLTSVGAEIRLSMISFNSYPFCLSFKWDRGLDRPAPIGGDRFAISLGYSFDNWDMIEQPDYLSPSRIPTIR